MGRPIELRLHRRASKKRNNQQESTRVADGSHWCATKYHGKLAKLYYGSTSRHVNEMDGWMEKKRLSIRREESGDSSPEIRRGRRIKKERTKNDGCNDRRAKNRRGGSRVKIESI